MIYCLNCDDKYNIYKILENRKFVGKVPEILFKGIHLVQYDLVHHLSPLLGPEGALLAAGGAVPPAAPGLAEHGEGGGAAGLVGSQSGLGETFLVGHLKPATAGRVLHLQAVLETWQGCWSGVEETIIGLKRV